MQSGVHLNINGELWIWCIWVNLKTKTLMSKLTEISHLKVVIMIKICLIVQF